MTPPTPAPARILLVDDQPANLLAFEAVLADLGHELATAGSGEEALRRLLREDFALVLLDVRMGGMDGFETARAMRGRERSRNTPVIFITADEGRDFPAEEGYALGAVDFIVKPVRPAVLRAKVAVFVELFRKTRQVADLLERRRIEEALRRAESRKAAILEAALDAVITIDHEGRVVDFNQAAERTFGYARTDAVGEDLAGLIVPPRLRPDHYGGLARFLATGEGPLLGKRVEIPALRADGTEIPVELAVARIPGEPPLFTAYLRDLRAAKEAERERERLLRESQEALLRAAAGEARLAEEGRRKDHFLALLGHELRNPLAPIRNAASILSYAEGDPKALREARDMIERQVMHLTRLVDELLDASRIANGKIQLKREPLDLAGLVRSAAGDHRHALEASGLTLEVDAPAAPAWVDGDPVRLTQVVSNLLHNATKFTDPGGSVTVRVAPDAAGGDVAVSVRDTGTGIEPALLGRLFEPFSQADRSLDRSRGGLGLGLSVVRGLVRLHGGEVRAESAGLGKGSLFSFKLPAAPAPAAEKAAEAGAGPASGLRILIVEDNQDAADSLRMLLELAGGHTVAVAYSGAEGVGLARMFRPDAVLCDLGLPGMSGFDVARALRADPATASARLIAVSGYGRDEDRRRASQAGFDHALVKPVELSALQRLLGGANGAS